MGGSQSAEEVAQMKNDLATRFYNGMIESGALPDVGIDGSLLAYSSLNSSGVLQGYTSQLQEHLGTSAAAYVEGLGSALGGFTSIPNAVGLGALLISMVIELALLPHRKPAEDNAGLLRRVFAEEKASEVRNLMDEYVKRYEMFLRDEKRLIEETRRLEQQLSVQLTRLRNSMLREGQMSSRSLKHWANGAAFHAQMVIHLARLQRGSSTPARVAIKRYQDDLKQLLPKYKEYKASRIIIRYSSGMYCAKSNRRKRYYGTYTQYYCFLCDSELGRGTSFEHDGLTKTYNHCNEGLLELYMDKVFSLFDRITGIETYFSELATNLNALIDQHSEFRVR